MSIIHIPCNRPKGVNVSSISSDVCPSFFIVYV